MSNLDLRYRPLLIGVGIINARVKEPGTIGMFAHDEGGATWLISCYHVLCDSGLGPYMQDELIYQPAATIEGNEVAITNESKSNIELDCAAARLKDGIASEGKVFGLGALKGTLPPKINMRVMKVGALSGLTEGVVTQVIGTSVIVRADPDYPADYIVSRPGDSGAIWIEQSSGAAIALHCGLRTPRAAAATSIVAVLDALKLAAI